ncbi:MAG: asparagine synthase (glutamine-hydrolyzing), partial [Pseudomonadales bacterium]|nr:asparagine synthase (glutamine-hydrolyzing) [Pseudomonadales bacterium]
DTEVLLAGLVLYGEAFIPRMEGMWAFALWDNLQKSVLISRDRTGKKPIFYTTEQGRFACASELPALNAIWGQRWEEDLNTTADYFRYGYPLPGYTFFKNVYELKPASSLKWSKSGGISESVYWQPIIEPFAGTYIQAQERLREVMDQSIERRLVSDVEVGSFLSGGIDSSIVSALASEKHGASQFKTFTIGFNESTYDERKFARLVASHIGVEHYEGVLDDWSPDTLKNLLLERVGQPFQDSSLLPTAEVSRVASEHVKVALSGDGADELFCGYQRYKARAILNTYQWVPAAARKSIRQWVGMLPEPDAHHSRSILKKMHLFMDVMDRRDAEEPYTAPVFFSNTVFFDIFPDLAALGHKYQAPWCSDLSVPDIKKMMLSDTFVYLPQDIHTKVDRASMAYSLETRAPFMDTQVVELALSLPLKYSFSWRQNKRILADTFGDLLPKDVWARRKQGFAVPLAGWFRGDLGNALEKMILNMDSTIPIERLGAMNLLVRHRSNDKDYGYRLWLLYVYLVWKEECGYL